MHNAILQKLLAVGMASMLVAAFLSPLQCHAEVAEQSDSVLYYTQSSSGTLTITGVEEGTTQAVIPETIDGFPVTEIAPQAFQGSETLETVSVPITVTIIGNGAFANCAALERVTISDGLETIGGHAFEGCTALRSVYLPDTLTQLGNYAFYGCETLEQIDCGSGLKTIGAYAFSRCTSLRAVRMPEGLESIGDYAYSMCSSLKEFSIPQSVEAVGVDAFWQSGFMSVQDSDFVICDGVLLTYQGSSSWIEIPSEVRLLAGGFLSSNQTVNAVVIPSGMLRIADNAFCGSTTIQQIDLPEGITEIGKNAFMDCLSISDLTLPDSLEIIDDGAFRGCIQLWDIEIPEHVSYIGANAFADCNMLSVVLCLSEDCEIADSPDVFPESTLLVGYLNSTLEAYAVKWACAFEEIEMAAVTTTTVTAEMPPMGTDTEDGMNQETTVENATSTFPVATTQTTVATTDMASGELPLETTQTTTTLDNNDGIVSTGSETSCTTVPEATTEAVTIWTIVTTTTAATIRTTATTATTVTTPWETATTVTIATSATTDLTLETTTAMTSRLTEPSYLTQTTTVTESTSVSTDPTPDHKALPGDADQDGTVTIWDAYLTLCIYVEISVGNMPQLTAAQFLCMDVTCDGRITMQDTYYILLYYSMQCAGYDVDMNEIVQGMLHHC